MEFYILSLSLSLSLYACTYAGTSRILVNQHRALAIDKNDNRCTTKTMNNLVTSIVSWKVRSAYWMLHSRADASSRREMRESSKNNGEARDTNA